MNRKLVGSLALAALALAGSACSATDNTNTANANGNANVVATTTTRPGPDGSEITTSVDASGVRTETRVFHNNPRVSKVVVTTRDGRRTATVYAPTGESKELAEDVGDVLVVTGNAIADGVGWTADKAEDVGQETKDAVKTGAEKTAEGAKKVGEKTVEGAKKAGSAVKKAITP